MLAGVQACSSNVIYTQGDSLSRRDGHSGDGAGREPTCNIDNCEGESRGRTGKRVDRAVRVRPGLGEEVDVAARVRMHRHLHLERVESDISTPSYYISIPTLTPA